MSRKASPPVGADVATSPAGGELHPSDTPVWDELADRWAELVDAGALDALVLPEIDDVAGGIS